MIYLECGLSFKDWEVRTVELTTCESSFTDEIYPVTRITMKDGMVIEIRTPADEDPTDFLHDVLRAIENGADMKKTRHLAALNLPIIEEAGIRKSRMASPADI